jgi:type IV pilus assembly protein PilA
MVWSKRGQRGFTLIELLIVVAILGVLAAVVIPNVGRFLGTGESAAADTELHNVQSAVVAMMTDANITAIPAPETAGTGDMAEFPDGTTLNTAATDEMYALWDADPDDDGTAGTNYVTFASTTYCYTVTADGTVTQLSTKWTGSACQ